MSCRRLSNKLLNTVSRKYKIVRCQLVYTELEIIELNLESILCTFEEIIQYKLGAKILEIKDSIEAVGLKNQSTFGTVQNS